ncbi:MAG TPA: hypothetical protein VFO62_01980 [Candidatus Binatia bacterium]|nr:hypothetical protein [Candidatus Binatia bacterium]
MFGWTPRDLRIAPEAEAKPLRYRAEVYRRDGDSGGDLHLYDGGDFSPYCMESLLDLLRSEARASRRALDMTFELLGPCSAPRLQEVAARFSRASIAGLSVTVRASGHAPVRVGDSASPVKPESAPAPSARTP